MPKGLSAVKEAPADSGSNYSGQFYERFTSYVRHTGDTARVRFLEQGDEVSWAWCHRLPPKPGMKYGDAEPCLDQDKKGVPCPGCENNYPFTRRFWINVIHRDAPVWERNDKGWIPK